VSQELFDLVQAKLACNQQFARRNYKAEAYLLRALVSCGVCRLACTGRMMHPGYEYYWCNGKRPALPPHLTQKCPARYIPVCQLDELVWQDLCQLLLHPEQLTQAFQRVRGGHWLPQELQARQEQVRRGLKSLV
jgi:site-specific DNA recombinase